MEKDSVINANILTAIHDGSLKTVQEIISAVGLSRIKCWDNGYELLYQSLVNHQTEIAEWLLFQNCKVNGPDPRDHYNTPLHLAILDSNVRIVRLLLERKADVHARSITGCTAFHIAFFMNGIDEIKKLLVQYGADINANLSCTDNLREPYLRVDVGRESFLIDKKTKCYRNGGVKGFNILYLAILERRPDWVAEILSYGLDVKNKQNKAAFFQALYCSGPKIVKIVKLLKHHFFVSDDDINNRELIFKCIRSGHTDIVRDILKFGASVNVQCDPKFCCENVCTLLHTAVKYGRTKIIEMLINHGANVNAKNKKGIVPIYYSIKNEDIETTIFLLCYGANLRGISACFSADNSKNNQVSDGLPLHSAVLEEDDRLVKHLLEKGVDPNAVDRKGRSALHLAINKFPSFIQLEIVRHLLEYGADVDVLNQNGNTVLYIAVQQRNAKIITEILKHKPNLNNKSNKSAFKSAILNSTGMDEILEYFRINGFHVDRDFINNFRLLLTCTVNGHTWILEELLKHGTNPNISCDDSCSCNEGCSVFHGIAIINPSLSKNIVETVKLLLKYGANINIADRTGMRPIDCAVKYQNVQMVELFLKNGAQVEDNVSWKLLRDSVRFGQWDLLKLFINYGADVNFMDENGRTLVCHALENNKKEILQLLLKKGINLKDNCMPLLTAARMGNRELVEEFLRRGADVNFRDKYGTTALHFAVWNNDESLLRFFISNGARVYASESDRKAILLDAPNKEDDERRMKRIFTTPLHIAAADNAKLNILRMLLELNETDVNCKDGQANTPFHVASRLNQLETIETLLEYGANIAAVNNMGYSPFHSYLHSGSSKLLIGYNSEFQKQYHLEVKNKLVCVHWESMVEFFIKHVVKENATNDVMKCRAMDNIFTTYYRFYNQCQKEIESMKDEQICKNLSVHDLFCKSIRALTVHVRKEEVLNIFNSNIIKEKFPIYADILTKQFKKSEERKELLEAGEILFASPPFQLPTLVTQQIFQYLSVTDLRNVSILK